MNLNKIRLNKILFFARRTKFFLCLCFPLVLILSACDKESSVGLDVQPTNDLLHLRYTDSTTVFTKTVMEDSLRSDQGLIVAGTLMLGKYNDPVFGMASASIYTQLRLPSNILSNSFGANPYCDSVVISLSYTGVYYGEKGRKPPRQTVNVFEVWDAMNKSTTYYSNDVLSVNNVDLAENKTFNADLADSVYAEDDTLKPQLRIKLQRYFGQVLLNNQGVGMSDNSTFQTFLKGLYITANNTSGLNYGEGRINSFNLETSKITLYYHNTTDTAKYDISLSGVSRFANFSLDHSIASVDLKDQLNDTLNDLTNYPSTYIQPMAGVKTKINFPHILHLNDSGAIAINQAILKIKLDPTTTTYSGNTFDPSPYLLVFGINDDGTSYLIPDQTQPPYYFNGNYNAVTQEYNLNISRYIQQVLTKKLNNNGIYLGVSTIRGVTTANRTVIGGGNSTSAYQMKLQIQYTKLH